MKFLSPNHCSRTSAPHRAGAALLSLGALLGACSLDTAPESLPSRASLQTDEVEADAESSSLDTPNELAGPMNAAGAAAPPPIAAQTAQPVAAILPAAAAPEPSQKDDPEPENAEPEQAMAAAPEQEENEPDPEPKQSDDSNGCKPGDYEGVIAGTVNLGPLEVSTLTGKINLRLVADKHNENLLRVEQGRVEGVDINKSVFIADITGEVDCSTGELVQSEVERGMYADTTEVIKIGFTGAAEGRYSANPPALLGTWYVSDDSTLLAGQGTWTTTLSERE